VLYVEEVPCAAGWTELGAIREVVAAVEAVDVLLLLLLLLRHVALYPHGWIKNVASM